MQIASRLIPATFATILTAASLMPGAVSASANTGTVSSIARSEFCTNLQTKATNQTNKLTSLQTTLLAAQSKHVSTLQGNWSTYGTKLSGLQSQWQTDRNNEYAKLTSLAKTGAEKQAVTQFEATLNTAISKRESDNATARTTYQNSVMAAANTESSTINSAVSALQSSISTTVSDAETSCQSGSASAASIQATVQSGVNSAKQTYQTAVQNARSMYKATVTTLRSTETSTISKNDAQFQSTLLSATNTLKSAFGI